MIDERCHRQPIRLERLRDTRVARDRIWFVIDVKRERASADSRRKAPQFTNRVAFQQGEIAAVLAQLLTQFRERIEKTAHDGRTDPPAAQKLGIEHERAHDALARARGAFERDVVGESKIAS